ncbi:MAG: ribbon-helix-helix protein, CopG family [Panacagrimonas sp.]
MESSSTRATVYIDSKVHRALRLKAAATHRSISEIVTEAVRQALREDHEDLSAFGDRAAEKTLSYEGLLKKLKLNGDL